MATANASDAVTDLIKWTRGLEAGKRILQLNTDVSKQIEVVRNVAKQAEEIKPDRESVKEFNEAMKSLADDCDAVLTIGKTLSILEKEMNEKLRGLKQLEGDGEDVVEEFIKKLEFLLELARKYTDLINNYEVTYSKATKVCQKYFEEFKKEHEIANKDISRGKFIGRTATGIGAVAAGIAGFFVGGPPGAAVGVGAALVIGGNGTASKVTELQKTADEIRKVTNVLGISTKELRVIQNNLNETKGAHECLTDSMALVIQSHRGRAEKQRLAQEIQELKIRDEEREEALRLAKEENRTLSQQNQAMRAAASGNTTSIAKALDEKEVEIRELKRQLQEEQEKGQKIVRLLGSE